MEVHGCYLGLGLAGLLHSLAWLAWLAGLAGLTGLTGLPRWAGWLGWLGICPGRFWGHLWGLFPCPDINILRKNPLGELC